MTQTNEHKTGFIQLVAGADNQGMPILEKLEVKYQDQKDTFELLRSPLFVRNLAAGDIFTCAQDNPASYQVKERSGNLAIRVFRKEDIHEVEELLTPEIEKMDGSLDLTSARALVYSVHVNIGFSDLEKIFDGAMARYTDCVWYYGNIYDPADGTTPLHWWDEFLSQI